MRNFLGWVGNRAKELYCLQILSRPIAKEGPAGAQLGIFEGRGPVHIKGHT